MKTELAAIVGSSFVLPGDTSDYLHDATESRGIRGHADCVVLPGTTEEVSGVLAWCSDNEVPVVPRGGGTGFAGGAVPHGGVVLSLERLTQIRSFDPLLWRIELEAGVTTGEVRRVSRESGLFFPPDPGALEQSQIGGNIATNAGGPHAFKYGVTGNWVTGLEFVVPSGEILVSGGPLRKDVSSYDLTGLLVGSEGTLAVITAAWLRLLPAPEAVHPVVGFYPDTAVGCDAILRVVGSGLQPAALEYLDATTLSVAGSSYPGGIPAGAGFMVVSEADGLAEEAARLRDDLVDVMSENALDCSAVSPADLWRWREGIAYAVISQRGGKVGEDIVVPLDRLAEAVEETVEIGRRHGLTGLSFGHAGDGNVHSNFLVALDDGGEDLARAERATAEVFEMARRLGGSISGEHGLGSLKRDYAQWSSGTLELLHGIKKAFDPKSILNPGKKLPDLDGSLGSR